MLAITAFMVFVDVMALSRALLIPVLLAAMLTKATLISAELMDLKHERKSFRFAIAFSILFFAVLYALMVPDGLAVLAGRR